MGEQMDIRGAPTL